MRKSNAHVECDELCLQKQEEDKKKQKVEDEQKKREEEEKNKKEMEKYEKIFQQKKKNREKRIRNREEDGSFLVKYRYAVFGFAFLVASYIGYFVFM